MMLRERRSLEREGQARLFDMTPPPAPLRPDQLPLFASLSPPAREALLANALTHSVPPGSVLFDQGDAPTFQYILLSGAVHLFGRSSDGREVLIEAVGPPELILPAAVATASPALTQARTVGPARLLLIEAAAFRAAVDADPALAKAVIASLSGQFRRMVRQIKNLKLRTANQRVGCYVLALAQRQRSETVTLPHEKGLIASELGMSRESFSRALGALQQEGLVVRGEVLTIADRERLAAACGPDPLIDGDELAGA